MESEKLLNDLSQQFTNIPGVGQKNALKYAYWLATHKEVALNIKESLENIISRVRICKKCFNITTNTDEICNICKDTERDRTTICVLESTENLLEIETASVYNGLYFILGGLFSPIYGIETAIKRIDYLVSRVKQENIKEIILVISSTTEGDLTAQYIKDKLKNSDVKLSRISSGIPVGANINYIDRKTLIEAFSKRTLL